MVPLSHFQVLPVGVNPWGIIFADTVGKDLSRAGMVRSASEMSPTGLWGLFYSPLLDWLVAWPFTWRTGPISSMPWNALKPRYSTSVMQYFQLSKNSLPSWKTEDPRTLAMVLFWQLSPWRRSHLCSRSTFHSECQHRQNHGCRDGSISWPDMLASHRFHSTPWGLFFTLSFFYQWISPLLFSAFLRWWESTLLNNRPVNFASAFSSCYFV